MIIFFTHFFACLWFYASKLADESTTWVYNKRLTDDSKIRQYLASAYWAVMTLTTVGYGDIAAGNNSTMPWLTS